jgi:hypothetical protein
MRLGIHLEDFMSAKKIRIASGDEEQPAFDIVGLLRIFVAHIEL